MKILGKKTVFLAFLGILLTNNALLPISQVKFPSVEKVALAGTAVGVLGYAFYAYKYNGGNDPYAAQVQSGIQQVNWAKQIKDHGQQMSEDFKINASGPLAMMNEGFNDMQKELRKYELKSQTYQKKAPSYLWWKKFFGTITISCGSYLLAKKIGVIS